MQSHIAGSIFAIFVMAAALCSAASAQNVKITPLGSHAGELCMRDRATIFEDPTGVRILYDAGQSVTGGEDPRLGKIDVVILSHAHGDHIGDTKMKALEAGTCDNPEVVSAAPNSTTAEITAAKNAAVIMVVPLANFIGRKVEIDPRQADGGVPAMTGPDLVGPLTAPCLATVQTGGTRTFKASAASKAVEIVVVPAAHDSTVPVALLSEAERRTPRSGQREHPARAAQRLRHPVHQRAHRLPDRRHRTARRNADRRARFLQGEPHGAQLRAERADAGGGGICGQHARAACVGHRESRQRSARPRAARCSRRRARPRSLRWSRDVPYIPR